MATKPKSKKVEEQLFGRVKAEVWRVPTKRGPRLRARLYTIFTDAEGEWQESNWYWGDSLSPEKDSDTTSLGRASVWADTFIRQNQLDSPPEPIAEPAFTAAEQNGASAE